MGDDARTAVGAADDGPLRGLRSLAEERREIERREAALVRRARNAGFTWAHIATALGVSKQAVHKKHAGRTVLGGRS